MRLILAEGPLTEKQVVQKIFRLAAFSAGLAFATIVLQYYFLVVR